MLVIHRVIKVFSTRSPRLFTHLTMGRKDCCDLFRPHSAAASDAIGSSLIGLVAAKPREPQNSATFGAWVIVGVELYGRASTACLSLEIPWTFQCLHTRFESATTSQIHWCRSLPLATATPRPHIHPLLHHGLIIDPPFSTKLPARAHSDTLRKRWDEQTVLLGHLLKLCSKRRAYYH